MEDRPIKIIMRFPPPPQKGGITINTEDYACLAIDEFLNDVIIDFYLKYYMTESVSPEDQERTHVFSTFFYKRLTDGRTPKPDGQKMSDAEIRHSRVKTWTKNIDLFSKDFIVIPINENLHWFLAIICFPGLKGPTKMRGESRPKTPKTPTVAAIVAPTPPAPILKKQDKVIIDCSTASPLKLENIFPIDEDVSVIEYNQPASVSDNSVDAIENDIANESEDEENEDEVIDKSEPVKQPCILIFDSLSAREDGAKVAKKAIAILREYLKVEYRVKHGEDRDFSKNVVKGMRPKVPQQDNYSDCGLYVLQYVEAFFEDKITNFRFPIKSLENWFDPKIVKGKRLEICTLLHRLMEQQNIDKDELDLPMIRFKHDMDSSSHSDMEDDLLERDEDVDDEEDDIEDPDYVPEEGEITGTEYRKLVSKQNKKRRDGRKGLVHYSSSEEDDALKEYMEEVVVDSSYKGNPEGEDYYGRRILEPGEVDFEEHHQQVYNYDQGEHYEDSQEHFDEGQEHFQGEEHFEGTVEGHYGPPVYGRKLEEGEIYFEDADAYEGQVEELSDDLLEVKECGSHGNSQEENVLVEEKDFQVTEQVEQVKGKAKIEPIVLSEEETSPPKEPLKVEGVKKRAMDKLLLCRRPELTISKLGKGVDVIPKEPSGIPLKRKILTSYLEKELSKDVETKSAAKEKVEVVKETKPLVVEIKTKERKTAVNQPKAAGNPIPLIQLTDTEEGPEECGLKIGGRTFKVSKEDSGVLSLTPNIQPHPRFHKATKGSKLPLVTIGNEQDKAIDNKQVHQPVKKSFPLGVLSNPAISLVSRSPLERNQPPVQIILPSQPKNYQSFFPADRNRFVRSSGNVQFPARNDEPVVKNQPLLRSTSTLSKSMVKPTLEIAGTNGLELSQKVGAAAMFETSKDQIAKLKASGVAMQPIQKKPMDALPGKCDQLPSCKPKMQPEVSSYLRAQQAASSPKEEERKQMDAAATLLSFSSSLPEDGNGDVNMDDERKLGGQKRKYESSSPPPAESSKEDGNGTKGKKSAGAERSSTSPGDKYLWKLKNNPSIQLTPTSNAEGQTKPAPPKVLDTDVKELMMVRFPNTRKVVMP